MPPTAVTIGNFDGVHLGHRALLRACREAATPAGRVVVIAFDPHPQSVLAARAVPDRLTTFDQRAALLRAAGADEVRRLEPSRELHAMPAGVFAERLLDEFAPAAIVEGANFRFGSRRAGDLALLARVAEPRGCRVVAIDPVEADLSDQTLVPVSSTRVRWLLAHGRVADAARLLGRPYRLEGPVVRCHRRGRTIGFPTANIDAPTVLPANGVYAAAATLPDGRTLPAAVNVGTRPTVDGTHRCAEAFLLDVGTDPARWSPLPGLPEYGWPLALDMIEFLRDEVRFNSIDLLIEQMHRDCDRVRALLETRTGAPA
jgi:riboflavin kinase/FMN adenylyltransferase